jgi:hypothetical protein
VKERIGIRLSSLDTGALKTTRTRIWERWALKLTSPAGVMLSVPFATFVVGCALVVLSYERFLAFDEAAALERAGARRAQAELGIRRSLAVADTLLDRVRELSRKHADAQNPSELAYSLADLGARRAGLTWLSLSFPDGRFQGVFRDTDGSLCFQQSHIVGSATHMERFELRDGALKLKSQASFHYDPRERGFYRLAVEQKRRVWTPPYTFYPDFRTGITRAEAVFDAAGALSTVITADYDVTELSGILSEASRARETLVLFTTAGVVLGVSGLDKDPRKAADERALTFADLGRPELFAFSRSRSSEEPFGLREFVSGAHTFVAIEQPLEGAPELKWRLAFCQRKRCSRRRASTPARSSGSPPAWCSSASRSQRHFRSACSGSVELASRRSTVPIR